MNDTKAPATETDNKEHRKEPSDARIILGPLVKYAAMGLVIVSIIITTAVMLDRQFNNIDREVAELEAQLAQAQLKTKDRAEPVSSTEVKAEPAPAVEAVTMSQQPAIPEVAEVTAVEKPSASIVDNTVDIAPAVSQQEMEARNTESVVTETTAVAQSTEAAAVEVAVTEDAVAEDTVAENARTRSDYFDKSFDELIAERNTYLKEMDRIYLEEFKASRQKQLQFMRERLARQEQRIEEMERRNQEIYDIRAADMKERQEWRENLLNDRI